MARLGVAMPVTEKCLNHSSGSHANPLVKIYQHYDHAKEIVKAFQLWSAHVESVVGEKKMKVAA
jgi:hypothetical protein